MKSRQDDTYNEEKRSTTHENIGTTYTDTDEAIDNSLEETLVYIFRDLNSQSAQEFAVKVLRDLRQMIQKDLD